VPTRPPAPASGGAAVGGREGYEAWMRSWLAVDFGQRCRYRAENAQLGPAGPRRVVLIGDSITEAWGRLAGEMFNEQMVDRGISGQVSEQMLVRFREDALALKPAMVQIMAGTNDLAGNRGPTTVALIEGNIASMAELARANGVQVLIASIPPAKAFPWAPGLNPAPDIRAINGWLRDYAAREKFTYVDYHAALTDADGGFRKEYSSDGVHPNAAGYAVMRPILETALASVQAVAQPVDTAGPIRKKNLR
jgi:lysophospholipase L1-like esterase